MFNPATLFVAGLVVALLFDLFISQMFEAQRHVR